MVVVEKSRRSNLQKLLLLVLKYIPIVIALCYMFNTMFYIEPLSNIAGVSLLTWIFLYLSSIVFEFCSCHRIFLWYILMDDILNIIDTDSKSYFLLKTDNKTLKLIGKTPYVETKCIAFNAEDKNYLIVITRFNKNNSLI